MQFLPVLLCFREIGHASQPTCLRRHGAGENPVDVVPGPPRRWASSTTRVGVEVSGEWPVPQEHIFGAIVYSVKALA